MTPDSSAPFILYHYGMSPYAQKIRAMLGYAGVDWQSVTTAGAPPRPELAALAGGYRKIPVAQIGADVFCDSRTIAREIAALADKPALSPDNVSESGQQWIDRAEGRLFFACVIASVGLKFTVGALRTVSLSGLKAIMVDRREMAKTSTIQAPDKKEAKAMALEHLAQVEAQLSGEYLLGAEPKLADFAVYHPLWMLHIKGGKRFVRRFPKTVAWIERLTALSAGNSQEITADQALATAKQHQPRAIDEADKQHELIGKKVRVGPNDYAQDATEGELVGSTDATWIVARQHPQTGLVHVHFPKQGFDLAGC